MLFDLQSPFKPTGDQPEAIKKLQTGLEKKLKAQTLLGVTGSGKTFTMANLIAQNDRPVLIISHNKTLAAQLYGEFKQFFPNNAVHYFVSFYDYYQPEAYIPQTDTYIEKEATINEEIDRLRHAATQSLINRRDVIVIASVSCIYGLGERADYLALSQKFSIGQNIKRNDILQKLIKIQYNRNDLGFYRGEFRVNGDTIDIHLATGEGIVRLIMFGNTIQTIQIINIKPGIDPVAWISNTKHNQAQNLLEVNILPAKHYMAPENQREAALTEIEAELKERLVVLKQEEKFAEAARLDSKTNYDLEMIREVGYCNGIENYSRHLSHRPAHTPPATLMDFFPKDYLLFIDESHVSIPQIRGMQAGDKSRKQTLIDFGFRLPSALDNRPLNFTEFNKRVNQVIYVSATPSEYEIHNSTQVVEQIIRPTGLLDPIIEVRDSTSQISDLISEIHKKVVLQQRVLVTTITKRMAEELTDYLLEEDIKVNFIHSDVKTMERVAILRDLRTGKYDVIVGVNLLREGLDLPEVALVAILDADKSGFLRNETALIQTIGRAARHLDGQVIMYGKKVTPAMKYAINETKRRRLLQEKYNLNNNINPQSTQARLHDHLSNHS